MSRKRQKPREFDPTIKLGTSYIVERAPERKRDDLRRQREAGNACGKHVGTKR